MNIKWTATLALSLAVLASPCASQQNYKISAVDKSAEYLDGISEAHEYFGKKQVSFNDIKLYMDGKFGKPKSFSFDEKYLYLHYIDKFVDNSKQVHYVTTDCKAWYETITQKTFFGITSTSDPFLTGECNSKM